MLDLIFLPYYYNNYTNILKLLKKYFYKKKFLFVFTDLLNSISIVSISYWQLICFLLTAVTSSIGRLGSAVSNLEMQFFSTGSVQACLPPQLIAFTFHPQPLVIHRAN